MNQQEMLSEISVAVKNLSDALQNRAIPLTDNQCARLSDIRHYLNSLDTLLKHTTPTPVAAPAQNTNTTENPISEVVDTVSEVVVDTVSAVVDAVSSGGN